MTLRKTALAGTFLLMLLAVGALFPLLGQGETIITIAVPSWMSDVFNNSLFDDFEAQNPGTKVIAVPTEDTYFSSPAFDLDTHLDGVQAYAQSADVLYIQSGVISPETTRAGHILDLSPLIEGNGTFDVDDFYPAMLESFQWDRGTWAIPVAGSVSMFVYDRLAFDDAGLAYPNENWTFADIANAARTLTQYDENGDPTIPGMLWFDPAAMYYVFYGNNFYDETQIPAQPDLLQPNLAEYLEEWQAVQEEIMPENMGDVYNQIPFGIDQLWRLSNNSFAPNDTEEHDWQAALLPGGRVTQYVTGFGMSAGTENPELAFALIDYLTRDPLVIQRIFGDSSARRSMVGVEPEDSNFFVGNEIPEEARALLETGLENAIPTSELRYSDYLYTAISSVQEDNVDMATALEEAQAQAEENLALAEERRQTVQVAVVTPVPTPIVGADQTVISFGLNSFSSDIPNREGWNDLIDDFLSTHPRIGNVDLVPPNFGPNGPDITEYDCYFTQYNQLSFPQFDTSDLLNLDPFMDADPNFDPNDFFGNALTQVQRDSMTWAYPIVMQPDILWYDKSKFADAGLPEPEGGWTIDAFMDAMQTLSFMSESDEPVFEPASFNSTYLLMLAAAFGGIPYDYRSDPPVLNFSDPTSINAMQQVIDLARDGTIDFQELNVNGGGGGFFGGDEPFAVTTDSLNTFSFRLQYRSEEGSSAADWRLTNYPNGNQYTPVAFNLGVAYINNTAEDPQACYEWIIAVSEHVDLLTGIPTRRSLINDPNIAQSQGEDVAALFLDFANLMDSPNVINFPGQFGGGSSSDGTWLESNWVNEFFNHAILEGDDLETLMMQTQTDIETYRACTSDIAPQVLDENSTQEESTAYIRQFIDCAVAITPELRDNFSWAYETTE